MLLHPWCIPLTVTVVLVAVALTQKQMVANAFRRQQRLEAEQKWAEAEKRVAGSMREAKEEEERLIKEAREESAARERQLVKKISDGKVALKRKIEHIQAESSKKLAAMYGQDAAGEAAPTALANID